MKKMPKLGAATLVHIVLFLATGVLFLLSSPSPLLASLGFESANLFVALMGPFICLAAALNTKPKAQIFQGIVIKELLWLAAHLLCYGGLLFANGLFQESCSEGRGLIPFLVIAVPPLILSSAIGSLVASLFSRSSLKIMCIIVGYGGYFAWLALGWWFEPSFRLISHLSVIITSDLLQGDTVSSAVIVFRQATLLIALTVIAVGMSFLSVPEPKVFLRVAKKPSINLIMLVLIALSSMWLHITSLKDFGKSPHELAKDYVVLASQNGLRVFADPYKTSLQQAHAILAEALLYKERLAQHLGKISDEPVVIWLYATNDDKYLYTGAKNVHFALPKHRQIHISGAETPHPVLGHELAHIYIGEFTDNWLGIPASNFLLGNFAISEGLAMALTPELNLTADMTLMEQAQALYHADIRMNMKALFESNINFALLNPRAAYIYAGAFLQFMLHDEPLKTRSLKIRTLIQSGSLEALLASPQALTKKYDEFEQALAKPIPLFQTLWAQKSFAQKSILVANCRESLEDITGRQKPLFLNKDVPAIKTRLESMATEQQAEMLDHAIDAFMREGDFQEAYGLMQWADTKNKKTSAPRNPDRVVQKLQCLINLGDYRQALSLLEKLDESALDSATRRLSVSSAIFIHSILANNEAAKLSHRALNYLMMPPQQATKQLDFAYALGLSALGTITQETLMADYLYARLLMRLNNFAAALTLIPRLIDSEEPLPLSIKREALFMAAQAEMSLNRLGEARARYQKLLSENPTARDRVFIADQLGRIDYHITHPPTR